MSLSAANRVDTELDTAFSSERAFRAWCDRVLPRVYGFVLGHAAGNVDLAEEITQQVFVEAVRSHRRFDGRSDSVTWLCSIARHRLAEHFRRLDREERRRLRVIVGSVEVQGEPGEWRSADQRTDITNALRALPTLQRAALLFMYVDGLPVRQIAKELGRSEAAIESLLARARAALRRAMGDGDDG